jgi:phosphate transport system substrate-binding protein
VYDPSAQVPTAPVARRPECGSKRAVLICACHDWTAAAIQIGVREELESIARSTRIGPKLSLLVAVAALLPGAGAGCGGDDDEGGTAAGTVSGWIQTDGSSTVEPFTALAAERFQRRSPGVRITRSIVPAGTGGGFERFCAGETDLSYASRPINDEEKLACGAQGIEYAEFQVANDAVTVVVNRQNDWTDCLTTGELRHIWQPGSTVDSWSQVRPGFPDEPLDLFGPGTASGTYDYFTSEIVGAEGASRSDYLASEDDNLIVQDVIGARGGLGYFGLPYFNENEDRLKALEIDDGSGCVAPSVETAQNGDYPLSRSLFVYVKDEALRAPHVRAFLEYAIENAITLAEGALLVPMTSVQLQQEQAEFHEAVQNVGK